MLKILLESLSAPVLSGAARKTRFFLKVENVVFSLRCLQILFDVTEEFIGLQHAKKQIVEKFRDMTEAACEIENQANYLLTIPHPFDLSANGRK
jgi:hypothetical protein